MSFISENRISSLALRVARNLNGPTTPVLFTSLPSTSTAYLTANYAGYTAQKAFVIKDTTGAVKGYVAIIQFNGKPVGVKFDAAGNFVRVLEQREGRDLNGHGWHHVVVLMTEVDLEKIQLL